MRTIRISCMIAVIVASLFSSSTALAAEPAACSVSRASLSFVNVERPIAIEGTCCGAIERIRAARPSVALFADCQEGDSASARLGRYCGEEPFASAEIPEADLIPADGGCFRFRAALPLNPDLRYAWEVRLRAVVTPADPQPRGNALITMSEQELPKYSLTHVGFDTDDRGNPARVNFAVPFLPSGNPPLQLKYAFAALPQELAERWRGASTLDAACLSDGTCGIAPVRSVRMDVPLPPCAGGTFAAGLVYPAAGAELVDATMEAARQQNGGALPKLAPASPAAAEEEWQVALVEDALAQGLASAGYLYVAAPAAVADNFVSIPIPAPANAQACGKKTP